jgi:arginine exporter protein ArgO
MTEATSRGRQAGRARAASTPVQMAALAVGAVFLLVGILGFIPGITTSYDQLAVAGPDSHAKLLGLFEVSVLHNLVHLLFGVAGIALARSRDTARWFLIGGGLIYLVLWVYGLVVSAESTANFVPVNSADNWLHLLLAVGMLTLGFVTGRAVPATGTRP